MHLHLKFMQHKVTLIIAFIYEIYKTYAFILKDIGYLFFQLTKYISKIYI